MGRGEEEKREDREGERRRRKKIWRKAERRRDYIEREGREADRDR